MHRRSVLGSAGIATGLVLAGCLDEFETEDPPEREGEAEHLFEYLPNQANLTVELEAAVYEDPTTSRLMSSYVVSLRELFGYSSLAILQEDLLRDQTDLDTADLTGQLVFGTVPGPLFDSPFQDMGVLIDAEWSAETVVAGLEAIHEKSYREETDSESDESAFFIPEDQSGPYVAQLAEETYVVGDPVTVLRALDIAVEGGDYTPEGKTEPADGALLTARDATPATPVRTTWIPDGHAFPFPPRAVPLEDELAVTEEGWAVTQTLEPGTDEHRFDFRWFMTDEVYAEEWADLVESLIDVLPYTIEDDEVAAVADDASVEREANVVIVQVEADEETIERTIEDFFPD